MLQRLLKYVFIKHLLTKIAAHPKIGGKQLIARTRLYMQLRFLLLKYDVFATVLRGVAGFLLAVWVLFCVFAVFLLMAFALAAALNAYWESVYAGYLAAALAFILILVPIPWIWPRIKKRISRWVLRTLLNQAAWADIEKIKSLLRKE